jgi:hypothetical protein
MSNYFELRKGNLLDYAGSLGFKPYVQVDKIGDVDSGRYPIWISPRFEWEERFVGYSDEIRPIYLRAGHLERLGFSFIPDRKTFELKGVLIGGFGAVSGPDPMCLNYTDLGCRVVHDKDVKLQIREDIEGKTISVNYLHALQDFLEENKIAADF